MEQWRKTVDDVCVAADDCGCYVAWLDHKPYDKLAVYVAAHSVLHAAGTLIHFLTSGTMPHNAAFGGTYSDAIDAWNRDAIWSTKTE